MGDTGLKKLIAPKLNWHMFYTLTRNLKLTIKIQQKDMEILKKKQQQQQKTSKQLPQK